LKEKVMLSPKEKLAAAIAAFILSLFFALLLSCGKV
jgi:hypothetical protein